MDPYIIRARIDGALRQLAITDRYLGQIPASSSRISLGLARTFLEELLTELPPADSLTAEENVSDEYLNALFGGPK